MATAAPNVGRASSVPTGLSSTHSVGKSLTWTDNTGPSEKLREVLCDLAVILANGIALFLIFGSNFSAGGLAPSSFEQQLEWLLAYAGLMVLACVSMQLYGRTRSLNGFPLLAIGKPILLSTVLFAVFLLSVKVSTTYWIFVAAMAVCDLVGMSSWRILQWKVAASRVTDEHDLRRALIIGAGYAGRRLAEYLEQDTGLGYVVAGFLDDDNSQNILGRISDFPTILRSDFIDDVFITNNIDPVLIQNLSDEARQCGVDVKVVPDICQHAISWQRVGDVPVMVIRSEPIPKAGLFFKRLLDIAGAAFGLIVLSPLLIAIAVLVRIDSPGPALYRSRRVGKKGITFQCFKFRTMSVNADKIKDQLRSRNQRCGPTFKIIDDPRITRIGKWLRKYSLDELPQLWNVLRGDMSLVGPRPHPLDDYDQYGLEHRLRLRVTPGLTGLWQITARLDPSFEKNMALDLEYIRHWSFWMDIQILARTAPALLRGEGR